MNETRKYKTERFLRENWDLIQENRYADLFYATNHDNDLCSMICKELSSVGLKWYDYLFSSNEELYGAYFGPDVEHLTAKYVTGKTSLRGIALDTLTIEDMEKRDTYLLGQYADVNTLVIKKYPESCIREQDIVLHQRTALQYLWLPASVKYIYGNFDFFTRTIILTPSEEKPDCKSEDLAERIYLCPGVVPPQNTFDAIDIVKCAMCSV